MDLSLGLPLETLTKGFATAVVLFGIACVVIVYLVYRLIIVSDKLARVEQSLALAEKKAARYALLLEHYKAFARTIAFTKVKVIAEEFGAMLLQGKHPVFQGKELAYWRALFGILSAECDSVGMDAFNSAVENVLRRMLDAKGGKSFADYAIKFTYLTERGDGVPYTVGCELAWVGLKNTCNATQHVW